MDAAEIDARIDVLDRAIAELLTRLPTIERETVFDRLRTEFDGQARAAEAVERLVEDASDTGGHPIDVVIRQLRRRHAAERRLGA